MTAVLADIFKCIFLHENIWLSSQISLKSVDNDEIKTIPSLVQLMDCRLVGTKPLYEPEPMKVILPTHTCINRPQWVNRVLHNVRIGYIVRNVK